MSKLVNTNKPKFDPNKPFEAVESPSTSAKPAFDPNAPHEVVGSQEPSFMHSANQNAEDIIRGGAQGLSLGFSDEIIGGLKGAYDVATTDKELGDLGSLYRQYQQEEQAKNKISKERSPYLYGASEIAGTVAPALLSGGAGLLAAGGKTTLRQALKQGGVKALGGELAETAATGALLGGTQSAGTSEHTISDPGLAKDIFSGAKTGAALGPLIRGGFEAPGLVKDLSSKLTGINTSNSPFLSQIKKSFQMGTEGKALSAENLAKEELRSVQNVSDKFTQAGKSLDDEAQKLFEPGQAIQLSKEGQVAALDLAEAINKNKLALGVQKSNNTINKIADYKKGLLSPEEAFQLQNELKDLASKSPELKNSIEQFTKGISEDLHQSVPGLQVVSNQAQKLKEIAPSQSTIENLLSNLRSSSSPKTARTARTLEKLNTELSGLEQSQPGLLARLGLDKESLDKTIKSGADVFGLSKKAYKQDRIGGVLPFPSMEQGAVKAANYAGQVSKSPVVAATKSIFSAPKEELSYYAQRLQESQVPGLGSLGAALEKSLTEPGSNRNALLFSIMQNPEARKLLSEE